MNVFRRIRVAEGSRVYRNTHFWIIILVILGLTFIYYFDVVLTDRLGYDLNLLWKLKVFEFNNDIHGSLFLVPLVYAALVFWWRGILLTWFFVMIVMLPRISYYSPNMNSLITNVLILLVPLLIVVIVALLFRWRESEKKASLEREKERQAYIARIFSSQEEERKRISREVHDDTTQRLWIVANDVQKLAVEKIRDINPRASAELVAIKDTMLSIAEDTKRLSLALRPGILDDLGLVPAIRWLVDQLNRDDSVQARISVEGKQHKLGQEIDNHLFRISQEALNNIRRHAEATKVNVTLSFNEDTVKLIIQDNGKGFTMKNTDDFFHQEKIGLIGIQERARLLDSVLNIDTKPDKGTTISIEFKS